MAPYGRGGAGNYDALARENEKISSDLEASQQSADTAADHHRLATVPTNEISDKSAAQYAHTGRGGAGNYYSPADLSQTGEFSGAGTSHILGDGTPAPASGAESASSSSSSAGGGTGLTTKTGRGGAGNYDFGINEAERRAARSQQEGDEKQQRLREDVERGVKEQLAFPGKAKVAGGEPY